MDKYLSLVLTKYKYSSYISLIKTNYITLDEQESDY